MKSSHLHEGPSSPRTTEFVFERSRYANFPGSVPSHLSAIKDELEAFGFHFKVETKTKSIQTAIESAFIKGDTRINLLNIQTPAYLHDRLPKLQQVRVKLEIDTQPPPEATFEVRTQLLPIPFQVRLYDLPSLMAGKLHAVLCRDWKSRVKGRDWYDLVWYAGRGVQCNLKHLQARMIQTGHLNADETFGAAMLYQKLLERIDAVDFEAAKLDVRPFIKDASELSFWSKDFFREIAKRITLLTDQGPPITLLKRRIWKALTPTA